MYKNEPFYDIGSVFQLMIIWKWLPAGLLDHISVKPVHLYRPSISYFYTDGITGSYPTIGCFYFWK